MREAIKILSFGKLRLRMTSLIFFGGQKTKAMGKNCYFSSMS